MYKPELCSGCQAACQPASHRDFARLSRPLPLVALGRVWWRFRKTGLKATLRHAIAVWTAPRAGRGSAAYRPQYVEALHLEPGEWVEVKSYPEISETLDARGANRGLKFLTGMVPLCGGRFRVHKRLETLFFEESRQIRKMKNTVLLEGVYCDGTTYRCDRSCFYYWREAWLRRAATPDFGDRDRLVTEVGS